MQAYLGSFTYLHSVLRYFILLFAVVVLLQCIVGMLRRKKFQKVHKQVALALLIFCDLQLVLGIVLYFYKVIQAGFFSGGDLMKDVYKRYYGVEHAIAMVIAIILIHVGYSVTKKNIDDDRKFKRLLWCTLIAMLIFVAMIPWESRQIVGRPNIPHMIR